MARQPQMEAGKPLLPQPTPWRAARKHGSSTQIRSVAAVLTALAVMVLLRLAVPLLVASRGSAAAAAGVAGSGVTGSGFAGSGLAGSGFASGAATATPHYRGFRSAFSFDADAAHHAAWMADVPDAANLTSLSIPGTHDTLTYAMNSTLLQCQNWDLRAQPDAGVRYVDVRARVDAPSGRLLVYHGDGFTGFSVADVLRDLDAFLAAHPSEAVVMRLKREGPPVNRPAAGPEPVSFEEALARDVGEANGRIMPWAGVLPTLGELRSKILLLQEFDAAGGPYGPAWAGPQMALEDAWIVVDVYHLADKWVAIRTALEQAANAPLPHEPGGSRTPLFLAHVSASVGVLPIEAAAGPIKRSVTGLNDMTGQWLRDYGRNPEARRTGIVIFDFPGSRAIDAVLA